MKGLIPGELYEFVVVAVDGDITKESDVVQIEASSTAGTQLKNVFKGIGSGPKFVRFDQWKRTYYRKSDFNLEKNILIRYSLVSGFCSI